MRIGVDVPVTERAWAAGFFDGEGNVGYYKHSSTKQATYKRLVVQVAQTHPAVLHRFRDAVGAGKVTGPFKRKSAKHKSVWKWSVHSKAGVLATYKALGNFLSGVKREQFERALTAERAYTKGAHARHVAAGKKAAVVRWGGK